MKRWLPVAILILFAALAAWRLATPRDERVKTQLVDRPVPEFALEAAIEGKPGLSSKDLSGSDGPRLVNIFGSWCIPCIAEAPLLEALAEDGIPIEGIAVRDRPEDIERFLSRYGDPFASLGADPQSDAMIAFGASGVPESFIIDREGTIRYHHQGPIEPEDMAAIQAAWEAAR